MGQNRPVQLENILIFIGILYFSLSVFKFFEEGVLLFGVFLPINKTFHHPESCSYNSASQSSLVDFTQEEELFKAT